MEKDASGSFFTSRAKCYRFFARGWKHPSPYLEHVIFHQERVGDRPLILAVFHESMELMERLKERLL
jgi:hypothetical protein